MFFLMLRVVILMALTQVAFAGQVIHCKSPSDKIPAGVQKALLSTVSVYSTLGGALSSSIEEDKSFSVIGSGFIVDKPGHVVISGSGISPFIKNGMYATHVVVLADCRVFSANIVSIGGDEREGVDAILLKINNPPSDLVPISRIAVSLREDTVYALGSPYGWMNTIYEGTLASSYLGSNNKELLAHINLQEGISGGALVNSDGVMLGVAQGKGYVRLSGFRIPISIFVPVAKINQFLQENNL